MRATQTPARHTDPKLTLNTYSHLELADGRVAVENAFGNPSSDQREAARATGTYGATEDRQRKRQRAMRAGELSTAAERGIAEGSMGEPDADNPLSFGALRGETRP